MHPKTVQKYLKNSKHFYDFVISKDIPGFSKEELQSMKSKLVMWHAAYSKENKIAAMAQMEHKRQTKITTADIVEFETTKLVRDTIINLVKLAIVPKNSTITRSFFTNGRNLLITDIVFINNGHRAGVLSNMTIKQYEYCKLLSSDCYCITVFQQTGLY